MASTAKGTLIALAIVFAPRLWQWCHNLARTVDLERAAGVHRVTRRLVG